VELLREKDPLMSEIKEKEAKYHIEATNAEIIDNTIRSGQKGKEIDTEKTYTNMKKYGAYNESLTVLKETSPAISIEKYYDKYVVGGNQKNKTISLLFIIKEETNIQTIIKILNQKKVVGTFFIEGSFLEKNIRILKNIKDHEFELLSYQGEYKEPFFKTALSYLESITGHTPKYCYTDKENEELLKLCKKLNLHTIKPSITLENNIYKGVKEHISNSIMLAIEIIPETEKELPIVIDYIKEKGYKLVSLEQLLQE